MQYRIVGFDLARAYAIFGMFIVNFNFSFGSFQDKSLTGQFLNLFTGNSTAIFIICAGIGVSLMVSPLKNETNEVKAIQKSVVMKRSWFLVAIGLLLYDWWPGDILHFYGGYMHIAAFILFVRRRYFLWGAGLAIIIFHLLLTIIPIETSWDFSTFRYADFWTLRGFLRNTLYNGWNPLFPWIAYFLLGMWLGRINWQQGRIRRYVFLTGLGFFLLFEGVRQYAVYNKFSHEILDYIMAEYFPPYLPFMVITASFALMVIATSLWLGDKYGQTVLIKWLTETGKMTLTHYILHLTAGMLVVEYLSGKKYTGLLQTEAPLSPDVILVFSVSWFLLSIVFSVFWSKKFNKGPVETLMRKIST
jgi:uncharacterized protein